jgi:threonine/homoserine/homoserine lactone efflux protein
MLCYNHIAYLVAISIGIVSLFSYIVYIIKDKNTVYNSDIENATYSFLGISVAVLFWLLLVYNRIVSCSERYVRTCMFIIAACSAYLAYFGFVTVHEQEVDSSLFTNEYDLLKAQDKNDLASILAIFFGIAFFLAVIAV